MPKTPIRYLSLFSGIEAASVAWAPLGWECAAVAEIEPVPCSVLAAHYPDVPNLGDVTQITAADIFALGAIDIVIFGSPCQDLSVAGKRAGLDGERSGLFHTAIQIIEWARVLCGLRYALWENVPGAFSSNAGADFAVVVGRMAGIPDGIDVPPRGWGNEGCAVGEKAMVEWSTLDAQWFGVAQRRRRVFALADFGDWSGRPPVLLEPEGMRGDSAPRREARQDTSGSTGDGVVGALQSGGTQRGHGVSGVNNQAVAAGHIIPVRSPSSAYAIQERASHPNLNAGPSGKGFREGVAYTLEARHHVQAVATPMAVRRLTPVECERLQGFPDDYTNVPHRGKPAADGPRYKALGNSMAVPVIRWIGQKIEIARFLQQ